MARARYPDVFRDFQLHKKPKADSYRKRAPVSYEALVEGEIRKGFSHELASQRVCQLHGFRAFDNSAASLAKGVDASLRFADAAEAIYESEGCSATEALRKARQLNPGLYKRLQSA